MVCGSLRYAIPSTPLQVDYVRMLWYLLWLSAPIIDAIQKSIHAVGFLLPA